MTDAIRHRGPDDAGEWHAPEAGIALGHRRLSIVDLSPSGHQPMWSASGRFAMVFNGEVYNYRALRESLAARGHVFRGTSDTTVMLAAFEEWGIVEALRRFAGMFAIAVWDATQQTLTLARDRLGEKPLYAGVAGGTLLFGSELDALRAHPAFDDTLDPWAVAAVLRWEYIPSPRSIYRQVRKLRPGEVVTWRRAAHGGLTGDVTRYWSAAEAARDGLAAPLALDDDAVADRLEGLLREVVGDEMVADVPVGAFLSGGIDSSLIVAMMRTAAPAGLVRTFTVRFGEGEFDESTHARAVARHLGTEHTEIPLAPSDALAIVDRLPALFDEPFADPSQLPTWLVSKVTREHVTVALSGDGGDELFAGYSQYHGADAVRSLVQRIPRWARRSAGALLGASPPPLVEGAIARASRSPAETWPPDTRRRLIRGLRRDDPRLLYEDWLAKWVRPEALLAPSWREALDAPLEQDATWIAPGMAVESRMAWDAQTYLPDDILVKVDRSAMAVSLETRAPFLDHRVFELAWRIPLRQKLQGGRGKLPLRRILARHVPPALFERPKQGFAVPLAEWLRGPLRQWGERLLEFAETPASPMTAAPLRAVWREHQEGRRDHARRLWSACVLLQWIAHHHPSPRV